MSIKLAFFPTGDVFLRRSSIRSSRKDNSENIFYGKLRVQNKHRKSQPNTGEQK